MFSDEAMLLDFSVAHGTIFPSRQHLRFIVADREREREREREWLPCQQLLKDHAPNDNEVAFMLSPSLESAPDFWHKALYGYDSLSHKVALRLT